MKLVALILISCMSLILLVSECQGHPWTSSGGNKGGWGWAPPQQNQLAPRPQQQQRPSRPKPQPACPTQFGPQRPPQQQQQQGQGQGITNEHLVKPVIAHWPRPQQGPQRPNQQWTEIRPISNQQQWQTQNNEALLKPIFSAWPRPENKGGKRPLVDVPFTIEIVSPPPKKNQQTNYGWST